MSADVTSSGSPHDRRARVVSAGPSLESLVGAHPRALRAIYAQGRPAAPAELGESPRGALLALEDTRAFSLLRPLVRGLDGHLPWRGKVFDHGGNAGQNVLVGGKRVVRFRAQRAPSALDGQPTLALSYDEPAFGNPWPLTRVVDELRMIDDGVAIGPALLRAGSGLKVVLWFGLSA
jgi:hypothetical protein